MKKCLSVMLLMVFLPVFAWAQAPTNAELYQMVKELERKLDASIEEATAAKEEAAKAKDELTRIKEAPASPTATAPSTTSASSDQTTSEAKIGVAPEEKRPAATEQQLTDIGGVLLPKGTLTLEPGVQYDYFSRRSINISGFTILNAIVIGTIAVADVKRDFLQGIATARYGITSRLEAEVKVPYVYTSLRQVFGPGTNTNEPPTERRVGTTDLGDIEGALYWHAIREKGARPDIILNFRTKAPTGNDPYHLSLDSNNNPTELATGNGHWGYQFGFTAVKRSDPVVFFGGAAYYWNVKRKWANFGTVNPGDSIEGSIGMAYALNEKFSFSTLYKQIVTSEQKANGTRLPGTFSNYGLLTLAGSYAFSNNKFLNLSVGIGVTNDAPDLEFAVSMPINFKLF
jgi:hypothetical protein